MRRIRRANYRKPKKLTRKILEARMRDILNAPTPEDLERLQQTEKRAFEEYMRRAQQQNGTWMLDGESRKKEVAKQLAEWIK